MGDILEIKVESSLKKIKCNDYDDFIVIDVSDKRTFEKFSNLLNRCTEISDNFQKEMSNKNTIETDDEDLKIKQTLEVCQTDIKYINELITEFDGVFGKDSVYKVFRENYENDPEYIPDESQLVDYLEALIPIMEKLFGERFQRNKKKYNVAFHGKHTKR